MSRTIIFCSVVSLLLIGMFALRKGSGSARNPHAASHATESPRAAKSEARSSPTQLVMSGTHLPEPFHLQKDSFGTYDKSPLLKGVNLSDPSAREILVRQIRAVEAHEKHILADKLQKYSITKKGSFGEWGQWEIVGFDPKTGQRKMLITHDSTATIAVNAQSFPSSPFFATGLGVKVGVWDAGACRTNHQEYTPRAVLKDGSALSGHATHVTGIIISKGVRTNAKGIAFEGGVDSYDWNDEFSELVDAAASSPDQTNKIGIANFSYGYSTGWAYEGTNYVYWGDWNYGTYGVGSKEDDTLAYQAPYLLIVRSAGNERDDNPTPGSSIQLDAWSPVESYDPAIHPLGDGVRKNGYDTISEAGSSKNALLVGAVDKAVNTSGTQRDISRALMANFSSWGPTDDGRVKPDLVASGVNIYTTTRTSSTAYLTNFTGTSASAPLVASIASALTHRFRALTGNTHMLSSTLKALLIAGADDLGTKGPDYQFGHGHVNGLRSMQIMQHGITNSTSLIVQERTLTTQESLENKKHTRHLVKSETLVNTVSTPIRIVLCWTDPPGEYNFNTDDPRPNLKHNLELRLTDPQGNTHFPYAMPYSKTFSTNDLSAPAIKTGNDVDSVEVLEVDISQAGNYKLEVFSKGTISADQTYSIVIQGLMENPDPDPDPEPESYTTWAQTHFGVNWSDDPNTLPGSDFDRDGLSNANEYLLGTDPTDNTSRLRADIIELEAGANNTNAKKVTIRVEPVVNQSVGTTTIVSSSNLDENTWLGPTIVVNAATNSQNTNRIVEISTEVDSPQFFFRAEFVPTRELIIP